MVEKEFRKLSQLYLILPVLKKIQIRVSTKIVALIQVTRKTLHFSREKKKRFYGGILINNFKIKKLKNDLKFQGSMVFNNVNLVCTLNFIHLTIAVQELFSSSSHAVYLITNCHIILIFINVYILFGISYYIPTFFRL